MLNAVIESSAGSYKYDQELDISNNMVLLQAPGVFLCCSVHYDSFVCFFFVLFCFFVSF